VRTSVPPSTAANASLPARKRLTYGSSFEYVRSEVSEWTGTGWESVTPYALLNVSHNTRNALILAISIKKCVSIENRTKNLSANVEKSSYETEASAAFAKAIASSVTESAPS